MKSLNSPAARPYGYLPEDLAEMFLLPKGNVQDPEDSSVDFYVVNP